MEEHMHSMEQQLWDLIDGNLLPADKTIVENLVKENAEWRSKYQELLEVNKLLHSTELDAPSMRFTKNVMEEIAKLHIAPATKTYINKKIIYGISAFFIIMIIGFLIYGFGMVNWSSNAETDKTITQNVNRIDYSIFFSNTWVNVLMMINVVIGLVLLDNYLGRKRKAMREGAKGI
jgi:hypothetical protein